MKKQHSLWVEAYRPSTLDLYLGNTELMERCDTFIKENDIPHLIFAGPAGTGKSTLAKILVKTLKCDYLYLNASDENGVDVIREKVKGFASTATFKPIKVIVLEEADFLTQPAQAALRPIIEEYALHCRFIFTCNYLERLIEPIQSRCETYVFKPINKGIIAKYVCTNVLDKEGIEYELPAIANIINQVYPDIRAVIKTCQKNVKNGKITTSVVTDDDWLKQLVEILKKRDKNAWYVVRQLVADSQADEFQTAYKYLFDHLSEFSNGHDAEVSIILDDSIWRAVAVPDKEINFAASIAKILEATKKKVI